MYNNCCCYSIKEFAREQLISYSLNFLAELCYSAKRDPLFGFGRIFGQTAEYSASAGCRRIFGTPLILIIVHLN